MDSIINIIGSTSSRFGRTKNADISITNPIADIKLRTGGAGRIVETKYNEINATSAPTNSLLRS
jgi:hypothetical protein